MMPLSLDSVNLLFLPAPDLPMKQGLTPGPQKPPTDTPGPPPATPGSPTTPSGAPPGPSPPRATQALLYLNP